MREFYVVGYEGGFMALDSASGGYPYKTDDPFRAEIYHSIDDALECNGGPVYRLDMNVVAIDTTEYIKEKYQEELKALKNKYGVK